MMKSRRFLDGPPFNSVLLAENIPRQSLVNYCQVMDASPTELTTVNQILEMSIKMEAKLQQEDIVLVYDEAIYSKALWIVWAKAREIQQSCCASGSISQAIIGREIL